MTQNKRQEHLPEAVWTIRVLSILLVIQAAVLLFVIVRLGWIIDWRHLVAEPRVDAQTIDYSIALFWMFLSTILTLLAAAALFFLWQTGWVLAMLIQAFILANLLAYYFFLEESVLHRSNLAFLLMGYSVFMVLRLNASEVRLIFRTPDEPDVVP